MQLDPTDNEIDLILDKTLPWEEDDVSSEEEEEVHDTTTEIRDYFHPIFPWPDEKNSMGSQKQEKPTAKQSPKPSPPTMSSLPYDCHNDSAPENEKSFLNSKKCLLFGAVLAFLLAAAALIILFVPFPSKDNDEASIVQSIAPTLAPSELIVTNSPTTAYITPNPTEGSVYISMNLIFDNFPQEIGWSLTHRNTGTYVDGVPVGFYPFGLREVTRDIAVQRGETYIFKILDSVGNGLCCDTPGKYSIMYNKQELVSGKGDWGAEQTKEITIQ